MAFHIVLNRPTDLEGIAKQAREGLAPRHSMAELARLLDANVHDGSGLTPSRRDLITGSLSRTSPLWWTIARSVRAKIRPGDVIFCTGEDVGATVTQLCGRLPDVRISIMVHSVDSLKKRLAFTLFGMKHHVDLFFSVAKPQARFLYQNLGIPERKVRFIWDQTDTTFFTAGAASPTKSRPRIASVGLERRDYTTLATATSDLDIDVSISGFSADTRSASRAFPPTLPANMSRKFYSWPDLRQLYRDSDIVVVSVFPNSYAAGVQGLMEALACGRPVIATATEGLREYLDRPEELLVVGSGNVAEMRETILSLLGDHERRKSLSTKAVVLADERHRLERYVGEIADSLRALSRS